METVALRRRAGPYNCAHKNIYLDDLPFSPRKKEKLLVALKKGQIPFFLGLSPPACLLPFDGPFWLHFVHLGSFSFKSPLFLFLARAPVDIEADIHPSQLNLFLRYNIRKMFAHAINKLTVLIFFEPEIGFRAWNEVNVLTLCMACR